MELSQLYFDQLGSEKDDDTFTNTKNESSDIDVYQCKECLTVYNKTYGDITQDILPETLFEDLPETYHCSLCEAPKSNFEKKIWVKSI